MNYNIVLLFFLWGTAVHAQNSKRFLIWPSYEDSTTVIGLSPNIWQKKDIQAAYTNGINLELAGGVQMYDYGHIYPFFINDTCYEYFTNYTLGETVNGIALGIWGYAGNTKVNGILISPLLSTSVVSSNGLTISFLNTSLKHSGIQISLILNGSFNFYGLQTSLLMNSNMGTTKGCQISLFNFSSKLRGLQLGLINKATNVHGIQVGIININEDRIMPILNW